jgi:hypothetical protein
MKEETKGNRQESVRDRGKSLGIAALVIAIISLFLLPYFLAIIGITLGAISVRQGSSLGWWAIGISIVSMIGALLIRYMLPL